MKRVINKGYTITVVSWENDGDNYNTKSINVPSKELAKAYYELMQLCTSKNNNPKEGVRLGNTYEEFSGKQIKLIKEFLSSNPILIEFVSSVSETISDEDFVNVFWELTQDLLGSSEDYVCRVMSSCEVTYSPEDIYLETITFK